MNMVFEKTEEDLILTDSHCTCEAGKSRSCNHLVGLGYHLQDLICRGITQMENVTCTSQPMIWNKPRGKKILPEKVIDIPFYNPLNCRRKKSPIHCKRFNPLRHDDAFLNKREILNLTEAVKSSVLKIGFSYLIGNPSTETVTLFDNVSVPSNSVLGNQYNPERQRNNLDIWRIQDEMPIKLPLDNAEAKNVLLSEPPIDAIEEISFDKSYEIERLTRQQASSAPWYNERKFRLTSSKFGEICKRRSFNAEYVKSIFGNNDLSNVKAIRHGVENEDVAKKMYLEETRRTMYKCGFVVHPFASHLGASPDGVVFDEVHGYGLCEIKCPYSKKWETIKEAAKMKNFCLALENGQTYLKRTHNYYYQIQGQMLITGLTWCDFVIFLKNTRELIIY
ncbi:hypothetical protein Zmor_014669 [Zophobas morio]|uniref:SWIM-type domain-containing protein n=1 Tax=Zophobas morio TaxID=2755281 RepID=A0AA38IL78_9CUCU|nr:hypothetical protein Zmor_014669 [Zophobas morio]